MKFSHLSLQVFLYISLAGIFLLTSSCKKDDDITRDAYIATYDVSETCDSSADNYEITISASTVNDDDIIINNLFSWGEQLNATIDDNQLTIPSQSPDGLLTFSGSGTIDGNNLTINFQLNFSNDIDNCVADCTKQ